MLDLIIDALHTVFDCIALGVSLVSMIYSKRKPEFAYPFGFERFEVVASFAMACFLIFLGVFAFMEGIHHIITQEEKEHSQNIFSIGGVGIMINIVGILLFAPHSQIQVWTSSAGSLSLIFESCADFFPHRTSSKVSWCEKLESSCCVLAHSLRYYNSIGWCAVHLDAKLGFGKVERFHFLCQRFSHLDSGLPIIEYFWNDFAADHASGS
jgi:Co/Zn/Cd efflux system component